jgi:hypothetical protein
MKVKSIIDYFDNSCKYNGHGQGVLDEVDIKKLLKVTKKLEKREDGNCVVELRISWDGIVNKSYEASIHMSRPEGDTLYGSVNKVTGLNKKDSI